MTGRVLLGVVLGAVALFIWGFMFWGLLPIPTSIFRTFSDEAAVAEALKSNAPEPGVYTVPDASLMGRDAAEYTSRHESGPVAMVFIHPAGLSVMPPSMMVKGFLNMLASVFLMALLLGMAAPALGTYSRRVGFVFLAGLVSVVFIDLGQPVWWRHTWDYWLANAVYHAVGALIVGLVLARFQHRKA
jgi:hypothetical protein